MYPMHLHSPHKLAGSLPNPRALSIQTIPTLGPTVFEWDLLWGKGPSQSPAQINPNEPEAPLKGPQSP